MAGEELLRRMKLAMKGIPSVGAIVTAVRTTGVCDIGERGVCYEEYRRTWAHTGDEEAEAGWSFVFESGRYDGFSSDEVREMLTLTGEICAEVMDYRFTNVNHLENEFRAGRFEAAFRKRQRA